MAEKPSKNAPAKNAAEKSKGPWVVQQARRDLADAEEKVAQASSPTMRKQLQAEVREARKRLNQLTRTGKADREAQRDVREAQAAVEAAAKTPGQRDDRRAAKALSAAEAAAGAARGSRDSVRSQAEQEIYAAMGPFIAEAMAEFPQMRDYFRQAIAGGWDRDKQLRELNTPGRPWFDFWQERGTYWQSGFKEQFGPGVTKAAWEEKLADSRDQIVRAARNAGVELSEDDVNKMARQFWYSDWQARPERLVSHMQGLARAASTPAPGAGSGTGGTDPNLAPVDRNNKMRELEALAESYGIDIPEQSMNAWLDKILDPTLNTDDIEMKRFQEFLVQQSKSRYAAFADQISAETSLSQLAGGYMSEIARVLELDPNEVRLSPGKMDPLLQRALTNVDPATGKPAQVPLWQFAQQIRKDERWQYTNNARDTYMSAASRFARALGFAG